MVVLAVDKLQALCPVLLGAAIFIIPLRGSSISTQICWSELLFFLFLDCCLFTVSFKPLFFVSPSVEHYLLQNFNENKFKS